MVAGGNGNQTLTLNATYRCIRLILGDQLNSRHSWFSNKDYDVLYVIAESPQETRYVTHHKQKLAAFFQSMLNFSEALKKSGFHLLHITLDNPLYNNPQNHNIADLLCYLADQFGAEKIEYQRPDEWRLLHQLRDIGKTFHGCVSECDSEHFLLSAEEGSQLIQPGKHNRMEYFYRKLRRRFHILTDNEHPVGGKWNFDGENRKALPTETIAEIPCQLVFDNDISDVRARIERHGIAALGEWPDHNLLQWPVNRKQSLALLQEFCDKRLYRFGLYQDAMTSESEQNYGLYHSRLAFSLNCKMLHPLEVIKAAVNTWQQRPDDIDLAQVEGFVRQILGWREYVRAFYWVNGSHYREQNYFSAAGDLPEFYWSANTRMACVRHAVSLSLKHAYAHHIQRLMVTGNLALLLGVDPDQVEAWYLGIYVDALEWVEQPNTRGMSQFADGGWLATKPYVSSGNYIHKMSDYCSGCHYQVKQVTGPQACPFNSLYWNFLHRHRNLLGNNPRMKMIYSVWDKKPEQDREEILHWSDRLIEQSQSL